MGKKVWITPFTAQGIAVYYECLRRGMKVCGFIDGSERCKGVVFEGVPVLPLDEYRAHGGTIALASVGYGHVFLRQLTKLGVPVGRIVDGIAFLDRQSIERAICQAAADRVEELYPVKRIAAALSKVADAISHSVPGVVIQVLEVVVTTRCNLKCRDCANLMQYYKAPADIETDCILRSIDRLFQFDNYIVDLNLLGGEPLLNRDLPTILDKLGEYRTRIHTLNVTTNGTILPGRELMDALIRNNAMVTVSDYGKLSGKREQLLETLTKNGIAVKDLAGQMWSSPHTFCQNLARERSEIEKTFQTCAAQCMQVIGGKLSYCVFQAHAERLRGIPKSDYESLDLFDENLTGEALREFCYPSKPLRACRYCTGMTYGGEAILPAVQTAKPLAYDEYDY
jgi:organic radical activating enzyme